MAGIGTGVRLKACLFPGPQIFGVIFGDHDLAAFPLHFFEFHRAVRFISQYF